MHDCFPTSIRAHFVRMYWTWMSVSEYIHDRWCEKSTHSFIKGMKCHKKVITKKLLFLYLKELFVEFSSVTLFCCSSKSFALVSQTFFDFESSPKNPFYLTFHLSFKEPRTTFFSCNIHCDLQSFLCLFRLEFDEIWVHAKMLQR